MTELGTLLLLVGAATILGFMQYQLRGILRARTALRWPWVTGRIIESELIEVEGFDEETRQSFTAYHPSVTYAYEVEGQAVHGYRVHFFDEGPTNCYDAGKSLGRFPLGATVTVHYDPADPLEPVLEPRPPRWANAIIGCLMGAPLAILGLWMISEGRGFS